MHFWICQHFLEKKFNYFYKPDFLLGQAINKIYTLAVYLGTKGSARTVGYAMNHAHTISPAVPAHRVVNRNGLLTGKHHFGSPTMMQQLLENEGIIILNDQIQDFEKVRWLPKKKKS